MDKILENGLIPAYTECPFKIECTGGKEDLFCKHKGKNHAVSYSCGLARAFEISKEKTMTYNEMNLKYDEIKAQAIPDLILSRPDGYNGSRINVQLSLIGNNVIEISPTGCYRCPAVACALDITEINWLIDNHPCFKSYNRV